MQWYIMAAPFGESQKKSCKMLDLWLEYALAGFADALKDPRRREQ